MSADPKCLSVVDPLTLNNKAGFEELLLNSVEPLRVCIYVCVCLCCILFPN